MTLVPLVTTKQQTKNGVRFHTTEFEWNLENISNLPVILYREGIKASRECYKRTTWSVDLRFQSSFKKPNCIELQAELKRRDEEDLSVDTQFRVQLEDGLHDQTFESSCSSKVHTNIPIIQRSSPTSMTLELYEKDGFSFTSNKLFVRVTIVVSGCCVVVNDTSPKNHHLSKLMHDFQKGYLKKITPDVELACGSFTIHAHRFILCSRSPVFRQELEHNTEPMKHYLFNATGKLTHAALLFVNYLYTEEISFPPDWSVLNQVFQIAKQYKVTNLQHLCGQIIVRSIDLASVCGFMKTAVTTKDDALKEICMEFMKENFSEIRTTEPWMDLKINSSEVYTEVISLMSDRTNPPARLLELYS